MTLINKIIWLYVLLIPIEVIAGNEWSMRPRSGGGTGLFEVILIIAVLFFIWKIVNPPKNIAAIVGALLGASIGSGIGIAGFGGAISGLIPFAILGFYIGRQMDKSRENENINQDDDEFY